MVGGGEEITTRRLFQEASGSLLVARGGALVGAADLAGGTSLLPVSDDYVHGATVFSSTTSMLSRGQVPPASVAHFLGSRGLPFPTQDSLTRPGVKVTVNERIIVPDQPIWVAGRATKAPGPDGRPIAHFAAEEDETLYFGVGTTAQALELSMAAAAGPAARTAAPRPRARHRGSRDLHHDQAPSTRRSKAYARWVAAVSCPAPLSRPALRRPPAKPTRSVRCAERSCSARNEACPRRPCLQDTGLCRRDRRPRKSTSHLEMSDAPSDARRADIARTPGRGCTNRRRCTPPEHSPALHGC